MNSRSIIDTVLREFEVADEDFFGATRGCRLVAARMAAAERLNEAGYSPREISSLIKRERTCVLYYLRPEMRAKRAVYAAQRYAEAAPDREAARGPDTPARRRGRAPVKRTQKSRLFPLWSEADTEAAAKMLADGACDADFRRVLGRTRAAARSRISHAMVCVRMESQPASDTAWLHEIRDVDPEILAAARRRALAPRSLTAIAFGDPPPGFSALDRRNSSSLQTAEAGA